MNGLEFLQTISNVDNDLVLEAEGAFSKRKNFYAKRWMTLAACLCLCFCCSVPVLAATGNQAAYEMLYSISPQIAQKIKPVNVSCIDKGIEMTVVAAEIDGEKATILVSMRDYVDSRIDETTDLFDSYSIHTPYDQSAGCSMVGYDNETNTATFLLTIEQMKHVLIPGDKITFSVSQLLCRKSHSVERLTQVETQNIQSITEYVEEPDIRGRGGYDSDNPKLMVPDEANAVKLEEGVVLTGAGMIDGKLHIQLRYEKIHTRDNHGGVYLKNQNGEILDCSTSVSFWDDTRTDSYEEYIFAISADKLSEYEIWREFWTCDSDPIQGDWQVTFPMEQKK